MCHCVSKQTKQHCGRDGPARATSRVGRTGLGARGTWGAKRLLRILHTTSERPGPRQTFSAMASTDIARKLLMEWVSSAGGGNKGKDMERDRVLQLDIDLSLSLLSSTFSAGKLNFPLCCTPQFVAFPSPFLPALFRISYAMRLLSANPARFIQRTLPT